MSDRAIAVIGSRSNGAPVFTAAQFAGAMGIVAFSQRIYLAAQTTILRLENTLRSDELADEQFDRLTRLALLAPRHRGDIGREMR